MDVTKSMCLPGSGTVTGERHSLSKGLKGGLGALMRHVTNSNQVFHVNHSDSTAFRADKPNRSSGAFTPMERFTPLEEVNTKQEASGKHLRPSTNSLKEELATRTHKSEHLRRLVQAPSWVVDKKDLSGLQQARRLEIFAKDFRGMEKLAEALRDHQDKPVDPKIKSG